MWKLPCINFIACVTTSLKHQHCFYVAYFVIFETSSYKGFKKKKLACQITSAIFVSCMYLSVYLFQLKQIMHKVFIKNGGTKTGSTVYSVIVHEYYSLAYLSSTIFCAFTLFLWICEIYTSHIYMYRDE